jgi:16S rRNA G1207 methylase RsmC
MAFPSQQFDRIIANPPFTNNQDVDHIMKMYTEHLATGGEMVAFASQSWLLGSQKKQVAFREFLDSVGASVEDLDEAEFKDSGTSVKTTMIHICKA